MNDSPAKTKRTPVIAIAMTALLLLACAAWILNSVVQRHRANGHDMAMLTTEAALTTYVRVYGSWPRSWDQLMPRASNDEVFRISSRISVDWNFDLAAVRHLMTLDGASNPLHYRWDAATEPPPLRIVQFIDPPLEDLLPAETRWNRMLIGSLARSLREP